MNLDLFLTIRERKMNFFIRYRYFIPILFSVMPVGHKNAPQLIWLPASLFVLIFLELFLSQNLDRRNPFNKNMLVKEHFYYLLTLLAFMIYCGALNYYHLLSWFVTLSVYILITIENGFIAKLEFPNKGKKQWTRSISGLVFLIY